jgi:hypothetical protein
MANVIKHKRGSGSDPAANNLVLGELAIRTDTGKLFTKMDSGAIAEIAGGGSDIVINTLSSSSATGGGSATFNGSAYRFTLSAPPNVSAAQLLVSINGVIQKPVAGTGQPSEGFSVDGTDIILGDAPATGSDFFILTFKSLGVSEPADNSVTSAKIVDGAIVNADINASAAISKSKIENLINNNADNRVITGSGTANTLNGESNVVIDSSGRLGLGTNSPDTLLHLNASSGSTLQRFQSSSYSSYIAQIQANDNVSNGSLAGELALRGQSGVSVSANNGTATHFRIDSSGKVGIGISSPVGLLHLHQADSGTVDGLMITNTSTTNNGLTVGVNSTEQSFFWNGSNTDMLFATNNTERMRIDSSGAVRIGHTDAIGNASADNLVIGTGSGNNGLSIYSGNDSQGRIDFRDTTGTSDGQGIIFYQHTTDSLQIHTNSAERMRIDSSGRVGINTTSPAHKLDLDNGSVRFNRGNSAGEILLLRGLNANQFRFDTDGLKFGSDTAAANALNDYEEGTWTPTLYYGSGTSEPTYSFRYAHYIKVGKQVTAWFNLGIASFTASYTEAYIGGLPFQSNDPHGQWKYLNHIMGYQYASGWGDGGSDKHIFLAIYDNQTKMMLNHEGNHLSTGNIGNNQRFSCTVTYQTD